MNRANGVAGRLGNVVGDQLMPASDLGVPIIGVGLLYQQGYFRQTITADRRQEARFTCNDPGQRPIRPARDATAEWVRLRRPSLAHPQGGNRHSGPESQS